MGTHRLSAEAESSLSGESHHAKGRDVVSQGRETISTAIERGREAYQQARRDTV